MNWGALATALLTLLGNVLGLFRDKRIRQAGADAQVAQANKETVDVVQAADEARAAVTRDAVLNPGSLRDDDGFRRPD